MTRGDLQAIWTGCIEDVIATTTTPGSLTSSDHSRRLLAPLPVQTAWGSIPKGEGWCGFLSHEDKVKLEYAADLKQHRKLGHGNPMKRELAKPLLHRILAEVPFMATEAARGMGVFWFAHTETVLPLLVALGLYKARSCPSHCGQSHQVGFVVLLQDREELDGDRDAEDIMSREFRMSRIGPFGQSLQLLVHSCDSGSYVRALHNEKEVALPFCGMRVYCPVELFRKALARALGDVQDYTRVCQLDTHQQADYEAAMRAWSCSFPRAPDGTAP